MTPRERIRHLHRRLGFGCTPAEADADVQRGVEATRQRLVGYAKLSEGIRVHPFEYVWREKAEPDLGSYNYAMAWCLSMATTPRPLEYKLALFWHDHFAVSDDKVESGPMMLTYLDTLRRGAGDRFGDLLKAVAKEPAMMKYLDMNRQVRGVPNENFAREVMELFTLGIGHYSEDDVQAAARALTGWGFNDLYWELPGGTDQKLRDAIRYDRPFAAFYTSPAMHDPSPKTILGQTAPYDGDSFLDMLAEHPQTARYLCEKLWAYFAYDGPEPAVMNALLAVWKRTHGDITAVVDAITLRPEFYSERCVRTRVKCPVDLVIGVARATNVGRLALAKRPTASKPTDRIDHDLWQVAADMNYLQTRMGMQICNPPSVAGWDWGTAWTSAALMAERMKFRGLRLWKEKAIGEGAQGVYDALAPLNLKTLDELAVAFLDLFDVPLPETRRKPILDALTRGGGVKALEKPESVAGLVYHTMPVLMASPEMNLC